MGLLTYSIESRKKLWQATPAATQAEPAPVPSPRPPFALRSFGLSDPGQVRPSNEDRFAIVELARTLHVHQTNLPRSAARYSSHRGHVFLVADGWADTRRARWRAS